MEKCPLCNQSKFISLDYPIQGDNPFKLEKILSCQTCFFGQAEPMPDQEQLSSYYSSGVYWDQQSHNLKPFNYGQSHSRVDYLCRTLGENFFQNASVLDIGAGLGTLAEALPTSDVSYYYHDHDPHQFAHIPKRAGLKLYFETKLNKVRKYRLIFANHVLEHVSGPDSFLSLIHESLDDKGIFYIEVPHLDYRFKASVFPHILFFSPDALKIILEKNKFEVLEIRTFGSIPSQINFRFKLLNKLMIETYNRGFLSLSVFFFKHLIMKKSIPEKNIWLSAVARKL